MENTSEKYIQMKKMRKLSWEKPSEPWRYKKLLSLTYLSFYHLTSSPHPHIWFQGGQTLEM